MSRLNDEVTVTGPELWTKIRFNRAQLDEWSFNDDLFMYAAPGAEPKTYWSGSHDREDLYFLAKVTPDFVVEDVSALDSSSEMVGWNGNYYIDEHQDGSQSLLWQVRLLDYDMRTGEVLNQVGQVRFRLH